MGMTATRRVRLGFSSCPNDTFMFHALVHGPSTPAGLAFEVVMEDIEALNERARGGGPEALDVTKLSAAALGHVLDRYVVLRSGAALGRGCGPLVVRRTGDGPGTLPELAGRRVAVPGLGTTAFLLLRSFAPAFEPVPMRFDRIMPAVARGEVEAGLIIHESRFTYADHGLVEVADLGTVWETTTGLPLPLGVIAIARGHADAFGHAIEAGLRASIAHAWAYPEASRAYIRAHAQELGDEICRRHIELYVNAFSADLGELGRAALEALLERGRAIGLLPAGPRRIFVA